MNYGGDAADQVVRYSLEGLDHGIRLSGTMAKHLAVFFAAVLKDQKKTRGKTCMVRMLKENRPMKFFTVPTDRIHEFCQEGKRHGLLYVVVRDRKNPAQCEVMVFADDAAKVNRVMDNMGLDFVNSENGQMVQDVSDGLQDRVQDQGSANRDETTEVETVRMPESEVCFEISELDDEFNIFAEDGGTRLNAQPDETVDMDIITENFTRVQVGNGENPSGPFLHSNDTSSRDEKKMRKPSVREDLKQIRQEQEAARKQRTQQKQPVRRKKKKQKRKVR